MRGFMTAHGQPDQPRSARYILKDYVKVSEPVPIAREPVSERALFSVTVSLAPGSLLRYFC